jgi:hypothetical protein
LCFTEKVERVTVGAVVTPRYLAPLLALLLPGEFAAAQTVVNSMFLNRFPEANYGDPNNWTPAEVPNNTALRNYNAIISPGFAVEVNVDATISNLSLYGPFTGLNIRGKTFAVTGRTADLGIEHGAINIESSANAAAKFDAGMLSSFSNKTLTGNYNLSSYGSPATLQFRGADISTLNDCHIGFYGPLARIVDESGNDALRNFARLGGRASLSISDQSMVTNAPFSNEGDLFVRQGQAATTFTAAVSLTNFDPATRTIYRGFFYISGYDPAAGPAELRFNGADIVNIANGISLYGPTARIADLAGNDGLRNLARILPLAVLTLGKRNFTTAGPFQNDDGGYLSLFDHSVFVVTGAFANFDPTTRTFSGGEFVINDNSQLKFAGADIVHNAAFITLSDGGTITDLAGNDGLRNFTDNLSRGSFTVGPGSQFTAPGNFTNSGSIETRSRFFSIHESAPEGRFIVPPGFAYTQTSGGTGNGGLLTAEQINILGGDFGSFGTVHGNVMVGNATITISASTVIEGDLTLSPQSHLLYWIDFGTPHEITGKVTLAGTLEVNIPSDSFVSSTAFFTILKSASPLTGVFSNAPNGARIPTWDGKGSVVVYYDSKSVSVTQYQAEPPPAQLLNISSRGFLSRSDDDPFSDRAVLIGGFIVSGTTEPKEVVLRGLGPSLSRFGLAAVLADPVLELHSADGALLSSNDNWKDAQPNEIMASGLAPPDDREAALRVTLQPGTYTVVLKEKSGFAGTGLVEIYDLSQNSSSKLANISTRGYTDSSNLLIGGIIAAGNGQANAEVVVRAIGPQLRRNGIFNALEDPTLELRDRNGNIVAFNDDWTIDSGHLAPTGLAPFHNSESAMLLSLPRGNYTAIVRAKGDSGGVALVEYYDLRR